MSESMIDRIEVTINGMSTIYPSAEVVLPLNVLRGAVEEYRQLSPKRNPEKIMQGDIVRLISGGPLMIAHTVMQDKIYTVWADNLGVIQRDAFSLGEVKRVRR